MRHVDNSINQFGKILIDFCTTFQCLPLNRNTAGDSDGQYTFVSEQGNSVIDCALVSLDFMSKASLFLEIGCRSESSHMPLHLSISYNPDHCTTSAKQVRRNIGLYSDGTLTKLSYLVKPLVRIFSKKSLPKLLIF